MKKSHEPQRILIVRPSALGDVCRSVTVAVSLRNAFPEARIDWLVQEEFADAVREHPCIDDLVTFPRRRFARWWRSPFVFAEVVRWLIRLRSSRYDHLYDFQGLGRSGFFTWASGARRRVGFRQARELAWLGYNVRYDLPGELHSVDQMLALLKSDGIEPAQDPALYIAGNDRAWWDATRDQLGFAGARYAVLAPTSRWASKRWPAENFALVVQTLIDRGIEKFIVVGGPGEDDQVVPLVNCGHADRVINLLGRTTIGQMMAVIEQTAFLLANDSAPLHIAVGLGRPCLGLFGPTDPARVGPWNVPDAAIRSPDARNLEGIKYRRTDDTLMRAMSPELVSERIDRIFSNSQSRRVQSIRDTEQQTTAVGLS